MTSWTSGASVAVNVMPDLLYLDIETYSSVDLRKSNVYAYSESADFRVLMCGFAIDDATVRVLSGEAAIREQIVPLLTDPDYEIVAHHAGFERICLSRLAGLPPGEYLPPDNWIDTAALAAEAGYPRELKKVAKLLGAQEKDTAGTRLINLFCKPNKGQWVRPEDKPEQWAEFVEYCRQDVETLRDVHRRLPDEWQTPFERELWNLDQRVNDRGIAVDLDLAICAAQQADANAEQAKEELRRLTGVANPGSTQQLSQWAKENGLDVPNWQAETVAEFLARDDLPADVRRVFELRQELALVASNKFQAAMRGTSKDGRLRGQFTFHGAHTGRWSGTGVQLHNMPRLSFSSVSEQDAAIFDVKNGFGASPPTLKKLVRPMFTGPFVVSDFNAIEARVIAWLAGEKWVLDAFESGRDIYVETAERMSTTHTKFTRSDGKVAVLALGFGGGVGALKRMGAKGSDGELQRMVDYWRHTNPKIVRFWREMERLWPATHPNNEQRGDNLRLVGNGVWVNRLGTGLVGASWLPNSRSAQLVLPSGRRLTYHDVRVKPGLRFRHTRGYVQDTYGGQLTENVVQAIARDLLAEAMVRLDHAGHRIVAHIHDEVVVEGEDQDSVVKIMREVPSWAEGLPIDASGAVSHRYMK